MTDRIRRSGLKSQSSADARRLNTAVVQLVAQIVGADWSRSHAIEHACRPLYESSCSRIRGTAILRGPTWASVRGPSGGAAR